MPNEKNHLYTPDDEKRDRKNANKRKEQQQFSRFSTALSTSVNNANLIATSPALQRETKTQIGDPYDDSKGSVSTNQVIDLSVFGANYTFFLVSGSISITFDNLPTGRHMMFVVDILIDNPGGANITFPQIVNPPVLAGTNGDRYVMEFVGVVRSDLAGISPPVETYTFISGPFNSSGITNPGTGFFGGATGGHIVKATDSSIINSTSLQPDSELSFFALPNQTYFLELNTNYISATNADIKFGLNLPLGASYKLASSNFIGSSWLPFTTTSNGNTIAFDGALSLSRQSNHYYIVEAGPLGGIVSITFAQNVSKNTTTILERGTLLRIFEGGRGGLPPAPGGPADLIGPLKGYMIGHTQQGGTTRAYRSLGGDPGVITLTSNQVPAMNPGKFRLLRTNINQNAPGNVKIFTSVNGIDSSQLDSFSGLGIHDTDLLGRTFVKDDLIAVALQRTSGDAIMHWNTWLEIEYCAAELWFYSPRIFGAQGVNRFAALIGNSVFDNPTGPEFNSRLSHQRSIGRRGIIKDFVYFGKAPSGSGECIFSIEVNGISIPPFGFDSPDVPVHNGFAIDRFDNVNIEISTNDLINVKMNGRSGTNLDGIFGIRFIIG